MTIPRTLQTLEVEKFVECPDSSGKVAVRARICNDQIFVSPSGLSIAGRITEVQLSSSAWTALPATPLADRNSIAIQNVSGVAIKLNYDNTESGYVGVLVPAEAERQYDITDDILIYAKAESGTPTVVIEELS